MPRTKGLRGIPRHPREGGTMIVIIEGRVNPGPIDNLILEAFLLLSPEAPGWSRELEYDLLHFC